MLKIQINQEFYNGQQVQDALEIIAVQVKHWLTRWRSPDWNLTSDEE
jgi:hypothetical protein